MQQFSRRYINCVALSTKFTLYVACTSMPTVFINIDLTKMECNTNEFFSSAKKKTKNKKQQQQQKKLRSTKW